MNVDFFIPLAVVFALAFLTESLTEYFVAPLFDRINKLTGLKWGLMYISGVVGIFLGFYYRLDLIAMIGGALEPTPVGIILSGMVIGRGANFVHQFVSKFFPAK